MRNRSQAPGWKQRGVAWVIVVIVVVVVVVVVGAIALGTSQPASPPEGSSSTGGATPVGCVPAGTQCRVFIQNEVSCCNGQHVVGPRVGWCVGWYDAIPCR